MKKKEGERHDRRTKNARSRTSPLSAKEGNDKKHKNPTDL